MLQKRYCCFISLLVIFAMSTILVASSGTQIGTVGARSTAMGSAFVGLADDWSAAYFNPGGLTQFDSKWTIGISAGLIMPRGSYTAQPYPTAPTATPPSFPFSGMYTNEVDATAQNFLVPALGIFYKANEKLTVGLGVYAPFGLGTEWDLLHVPDSYGNTSGISKTEEHYSDHQVINIQPTIAYELSDKISVGLGVSYITGMMILDQVKLPLNPVAASWATLQGAAAQIQALNPQFPSLEDLSMDQYRLLLENNLEGDGTAYGFNIGVHIKVSDKLSFGIAGRYATDLALEGTIEQTKIMHGDAEKMATLQALSQTLAAAGDAATAAVVDQVIPVFSGQNVTEEYDVEADLPLPMTISGGLAYKASPKLTLTADVHYSNWASWDAITVESQTEGKDDLELKEDWEDAIEICAGAEYLAMDTEAKQLFLRGGFYTVNSPVPDETITPTILDPNRRYVVTAGLGLSMGKLSINFAGEIVLFGEKDIPQSAYGFDPATGIPDNYAGVYNFNAMVFTLGTSYSF